MITRFLLLCSLLVSLFGNAAVARAEPRYFMVLYAAQGGLSAINRWTHSFASFVRVDSKFVSTAREPRAADMEDFTISWLPRELPICIRCSRPVAGRNYGLRETLLLLRSRGLRLSQWGPFEIDASLYAMATSQWRRLTSGAVQYALWDRRFRPQAVNCIHALTDIERTLPPLRTRARLGDRASQTVLGHLSRHLRGRGVNASRMRHWLGVADIPVLERAD